MNPLLVNTGVPINKKVFQRTCVNSLCLVPLASEVLLGGLSADPAAESFANPLLGFPGSPINKLCCIFLLCPRVPVDMRQPAAASAPRVRSVTRRSVGPPRRRVVR